jgi:uncharacterized membrane protein YgcG
VFFALLAAAGPAAARTLTFERWDDELQVNADGSLLVTENLEVRFSGAWNGIYRTIPLEYRTDRGFDYRLSVSVEGVTDGDYAPLRYEKSREGGYLKLKIFVPRANNATRTVIVKYRVANGLRFFTDHDELYWNVTGNEHTDPILLATARVFLPAGTTGTHTVVYTGTPRSRGSAADVQVNPGEVSITGTGALYAHEGMTIVVGWDKGFVQEPSPMERSLDFYSSNWPLGIPVVALVLAVWFYFAHGRDPELRPVSVQYEPPQGISPGGAGALIDDSADMRDITATIVDLAVRGFLVIREEAHSSLLGLMHSKEYAFWLRKPPAEWSSLRAHERSLLGAIFSGGTQELVSLSSLQNKFYTHLPLLREEIFGELLARHYYRTRPDTMHVRFAAGAVATGLGIAWGGSFICRHSGMQMFPFVIAALLTALIVFIYGRVVHSRTLEGTRALEGVLGFKEFLERVESDRFNQVTKTPEMFEKFLPYAMAFGCEKNWSKAFDGIYQQPPQWYQGSGFGPRFYPSSFASDLSGMSASAASIMASVPQSSGSSGFGGGGGSGGGFGGGGAGGF